MSVKEAAAALGVSDVTIYSKLKLKEFSDKVVKKGNKSMIDEDLFKLIKESLNLNKDFNSDLNQEDNKSFKSSKNEGSSDDLSLVNILVNQLNEKDRQIAQLTQMLADANAKRDEHAAYISKLLENEQVLRGHKIKTGESQDEISIDLVESLNAENKQPKKKWWFW